MMCFEEWIFIHHHALWFIIGRYPEHAVILAQQSSYEIFPRGSLWVMPINPRKRTLLPYAALYYANPAGAAKTRTSVAAATNQR